MNIDELHYQDTQAAEWLIDDLNDNELLERLHINEWSSGCYIATDSVTKRRWEWNAKNQDGWVEIRVNNG